MLGFALVCALRFPLAFALAFAISFALAFALVELKRSKNEATAHPNECPNRFKLVRTGLDRTKSGQIWVESAFWRVHVQN